MIGGKLMVDVASLEAKARQIRKDLVTMIYEAKAGHIGGSLSSADILTVLYYSIMKIDPQNPKWEDRDRFIMSKGHSVEGLYCILADKGFFPKENLKTFSKFGSTLIGHPNNKNAGIEMNTGALGHGLPVAVGMALAAKMDKKDYRVFTVMGDGEQAEGSVWEAAMAGAHYKLDNLVAIVDRNKLQITGNTEDVMSLESLEDKWASFGWNVIPVEGNNVEKLQEVFLSLPRVKGKPTLVMAYTIKGKGISFMENVAKWHHGVPSEEQMKQALVELGDVKINNLYGQNEEYKGGRS
jgi:transketolase